MGSWYDGVDLVGAFCGEVKVVLFGDEGDAGQGAQELHGFRYLCGDGVVQVLFGDEFEGGVGVEGFGVFDDVVVDAQAQGAGGVLAVAAGEGEFGVEVDGEGVADEVGEGGCVEFEQGGVAGAALCVCVRGEGVRQDGEGA